MQAPANIDSASALRAALLHRHYCALHAAHQDALLQSMRLHVIGGELAALLALGALALTLGTYPLLVLTATATVAIVLHRALRGMHSAIDFRAQDVNWAQTELLLAEQVLPAQQRTFMGFKLHQDRDPDRRRRAQERFFAPHPASRQEIADYFFVHRSQSRGRVQALLSALSMVRHIVVVGILTSAGMALL